jgi:hypothetical protein
MSLPTFSHPPWRLKRTSAFILVLALLLNTSNGLSEETPASESSRDLTKQLLQMDLGYNVLNNEMLRKSMGVSVDTLDNLDADNERLPVPQQLVRDEDVIRFGGPSPDGLWSDEKFWGGGLPQFFGGAFAGNNPRPASHPQRHGGGRRPQQVGVEARQFDAPKKRQFVGDQHQCGAGSCEFFLFCWLSGGVVEGGCGGMIFACCKRPVQQHHSYEEAPKVIAAPQVRFLPTHL